MNTGFDASALTYDELFTNSAIGKRLRKHTHDYFDKTFHGRSGMRILELTCGTGEDAVFLAMKGHAVTATDSSIGMLVAARRKAAQAAPDLGITFELLDVTALAAARLAGPFDVVFSNFGGLNCLSPQDLQALSTTLKRLLAPDGRFVAVVMSKYCLWEMAYYILKGKFRSAFRRWTNGALHVDVNGMMVSTFYYTPSTLRMHFARDFSVVAAAPIGVTLPPPYLEHFFSSRPGVLSFLDSCETMCSRSSALAVFGDHFLLDLQVSR